MVRTWIVSAVVVCLAGLAAAQQPAQSMNNEAVVKLAQAHLSDDLIIATINATPGAYNTTPDALIALKTAGVSDKVVAVLVARAGTAPAAAATPASPYRSADGRVRVYVTDHPIFDANELAKADPNHGSATIADPAHAQPTNAGTDEVEADLARDCPSNVVASNNPDRADFVLVFKRHGVDRGSLLALHGLTNLALSGGARVDGASLFEPNGDMIYASRQTTIDKAIRDLCAHIPAPAQAQSAPTPAAL